MSGLCGVGRHISSQILNLARFRRRLCQPSCNRVAGFGAVAGVVVGEDAVQSLELLAEVFLQCSAIRDVRTVFLLQPMELADEAVFDAVFPEHRRQGVGGEVIGDLGDEAWLVQFDVTGIPRGVGPRRRRFGNLTEETVG